MITSRPWGLSPEEEREVQEALRFRHFKWDAWVAGAQTLLPEAMVLDEALHRRIVETVEALHGAVTRFEARVRGDPVALGRLGIPAPLHPILAGEVDHGLHCARYDLFLTEDGRLMVPEFNEDVPGGFNETNGLPELLGDPGPGLRWESGFRRAFLDAFARHDAVALLYATAFAEDLQHMLILERWLADEGHATVLASPEHLTLKWRRPRILDEPVDAAFRFYPGEWMPRLPNFDAWRGVSPRLPMMNPLRRLAPQSKLVFALWGEDPGPDPRDRELLEAHCPLTLFFRPEDVGRYREEKDRWVLKKAFGRMGDAVVMGHLVPPKEWDAALLEASKTPAEWCAQELFEVPPVPFSRGPLHPALGAYVVNGRFAGYYSRAASRPFITHEAFHVATLVRAS